MKLAIAGFRHGHIYSVLAHQKVVDGVEIVAACEEDPATREELSSREDVHITHTDFGDMLDSVECDAIAIGDYYRKRGELAIRALSAGKHVISDKPICTELEELDRIESLVRAKSLAFGCMFDLRDMGQFIGLRNIVQNGDIGEVHAVSFGGQHPLMVGVRPSWYFEPGKHGGTINDIAIHAMDILPWITGMQFTVVNAARAWNAFAPQYPDFKDAGQMMLTMANGCGVLGDVSYFSPDSMGYSLPGYWRTTLFGAKGILETSCTTQAISVAINGETEPRTVPLPAATQGGYLEAFKSDINGTVKGAGLTTTDVLRASRVVLTVQQAADEGLREIVL